MAQESHVCWLTVQSGDRVTLRHAGKEYDAIATQGRRAQQIVERLDRLAKEYPLVCEQQDLTLLGESLFDSLFGGVAKQVFKTDTGERTEASLKITLGDVFLTIAAQHRQEHADSRLMVSLLFGEGADRWANLPWEFLYASPQNGQGFFVAGKDTCLSLTRIIPPPCTRQRPATPPHVLVIIAQPRRLNYRMERAEFDNLRTFLRTTLRLPENPGAADGVTNPEGLWEPTWDDLKARLTDAGKPTPDIIHFIGHGSFQDGKSLIALHKSEQQRNLESARDPQRQPDDFVWHNVEDLKVLLTGKAPWMFFLQTCDTGRGDGDAGPSRSAAQQIAQAEVPFVIAMQYRITAEDADRFRNKFYEALGNGKTVCDSVMLGREELGNILPIYGHPRFATPVIYVRGEDRVLMQPPASPSPDVSPAAFQPQRCPACQDGMITFKRKNCPCAKRVKLIYCDDNHPNLESYTECETVGCNKPLRRPQVSSAGPAADPGPP